MFNMFKPKTTLNIQQYPYSDKLVTKEVNIVGIIVTLRYVTKAFEMSMIICLIWNSINH